MANTKTAHEAKNSMPSVRLRYFFLLGLLLSQAGQADEASNAMSCTEAKRTSIAYGAANAEDFYQLFELGPEADSAARDFTKRRAPVISVHQSGLIANPLIIDVRDRRDFQKSNIPGSINFPLSSLHTKTNLKSASMVLVAESYRLSELAAAALLLNSSGFASVSVLGGGLSAWSAAGRELDGEGLSFPQKMPADKLVAHKHKSDWLIIDVSTGLISSESDQRVIYRPLSTNPGEFAHEVAQKAQNLSASLGVGPQVLLVDSDGTGYGEAFKLLPESLKPYTYYVDGGLAGYRSYAQGLSRMLSSGRETSGPSVTCLGKS